MRIRQILQIATLRVLDIEMTSALFSRFTNLSDFTLLLYIDATKSNSRWSNLLFEVPGADRTMASGAGTGHSSPDGLHPPAHSKAAAGFQSYAEYLKKLNRSHDLDTWHDSLAVLWLASFDVNGCCMKWDYCDGDQSYRRTYRPAFNGSGEEPRTNAQNSTEFQKLLRTPEENVTYRVVIASTADGRCLPWQQDILGLGLDLGPEIFDYATCGFDYHTHGVQLLPRPWYKDCPALLIGENILSFLKTTLGKAPRTGMHSIQIHVTSWLTSTTALLFVKDQEDYSVGVPKISTHSVMFPAEMPSQIRGKSDDELDQLGYQSNRWLVQRFITSGAGSNNCFGSGNFLYVCLAALVELHLSNAPRYVPSH
jgi:hypothetical protein